MAWHPKITWRGKDSKLLLPRFKDELLANFNVSYDDEDEAGGQLRIWKPVSEKPVSGKHCSWQC